MASSYNTEQFELYHDDNQETALQSDEDSIPGFISSLKHEEGKHDYHDEQGKSLPDTVQKFLLDGNDSENSESVAGEYPPGVTATGSSNLPIPEVEPNIVTSINTKRKRKKKKHHGPYAKTDEQLLMKEQTATTVGSIPDDKLNPQHAFHQPDYTQPGPSRLPPIQGTANLAFAPTAAVIGSALPAVGKTTQPEPCEKMENSYDHEKGAINGAFVKETEFTSKNDKQSKEKSHQEKKRVKSSLYFHNGTQTIDYVLAYEEDSKKEKQNSKYREEFEHNLELVGLKLEREPKEKSQNNKTCFIKIHVPWNVALLYAERMKMKMPLKEIKNDEEGDAEKNLLCSCCSSFKNCFHRCIHPYKLHNEDIKEQFGENDFYTAEFTRDKKDYFDIKDESTFFSSSERSRIAHRILSETKYGKQEKERTENGKKEEKKIGIGKLIINDVYCAAYPLHEGSYSSKDPKLSKNDNMRRMLYWEWARWGRWYKFQPLDLIRHYLGDKIAIYFAWLGFYTQMLLLPTAVGLLCFIYSIATLWTYPPTQEVCDEAYPTYAGNITMCPFCDRTCSYWKLKTSCTAAQITYIFDNSSTIFFAVFMSIWATMFLEFWKRRQFKLSYDWDLVDYDEDRDLVRPEYEVLVERTRLNPVTGQMEPYLHPRDRYTRAAFSLVTVMFWVVVVIAAVFAIIIYRLAINAVFAATVDFSSLGAIGSIATPSMLTTITASILSLVIIMALNKIYEKVAVWLTNLELPRTQIEFDDSFTFKMFSFEFVNFYSYLFYVAFFKTSFAGFPANYNYLFGQWRWEECDAGGCMYELSLQLIIIMLGKQLWNNFLELVLPWLVNKYRQWKSRKATEQTPENEYTRWEKDFDLNSSESRDLFHEYLEMVIQFGFVTLFVAAFPLAPVLALINNIVEIRLDANKFICENRRPLAHKCSDIGAWYFLLDFIGTLAVVTNAFTIAITSDSIPKLVYFYVYSPPTFGESTYVGFVNDSLSVFNVSDFTARSAPENSQPFAEETVTECRYRDYRTPPTAVPKYELTLQYWHVLAARFAFVIVMEHVVFFLKRLLDYLIPDRPKSLKEKIKREHFLVQKMLREAENDQVRSQYAKDPSEENAASSPVVKKHPPSELVIENERATSQF